MTEGKMYLLCSVSPEFQITNHQFKLVKVDRKEQSVTVEFEHTRSVDASWSMLEGAPPKKKEYAADVSEKVIRSVTISFLLWEKLVSANLISEKALLG